MPVNYYEGPGLGIGALGQAADSLSPVSVTIRPSGAMFGAWWGLSTVSGLLSAYHGFKRNNDSIGWALAWFLMGSALPVVVPVIAFTQGFAQPPVRKNKRRRGGYNLPSRRTR